MTYVEFTKKFKEQIFSIDYDQQLTLAIEICKRLYFDYVSFSEKYQWGEKDVLLDAITLIEQSKTNGIKQSIIDKTLSDLDLITPDMDDFGSDELGSYALNACVAVYSTIQFISDKQPNHIYDVGTCLTDTIDFKIQEEQDLTMEEIDRNFIMIEARKYLIDKSK
ncbi:MAG: DUF416 family protein [Flavobacterium sp.]|nr:MAG: DUF416 family protein [Flavobacterium sp.]